MRWGFGLEVAAIGLLVIAWTAGPSGRPSPSEAASLSASPGPTVAGSSPAPTASASASPAAEPLPNVHPTPLGAVTGNWLFYTVQIPRPARNGSEVLTVASPSRGGTVR